MSPSEHAAPSSPLTVGEGEGRGGGGEGRKGGEGEGRGGEGRDGEMEWILAMKECVGVHIG